MDVRQLSLTFESKPERESTPAFYPFKDTTNPRQLRAIEALFHGPCTRKDLDRICGASNSPELIASLRRCGLTVRCLLVPRVDRDGKRVKFGVYACDEADRAKVAAWRSVCGFEGEP